MCLDESVLKKKDVHVPPKNIGSVKLGEKVSVCVGVKVWACVWSVLRCGLVCVECVKVWACVWSVLRCGLVCVECVKVWACVWSVLRCGLVCVECTFNTDRQSKCGKPWYYWQHCCNHATHA